MPYLLCQEGRGEGGGVGLGQRSCSVVEKGACLTYKVKPAQSYLSSAHSG